MAEGICNRKKLLILIVVVVVSSVIAAVIGVVAYFFTEADHRSSPASLKSNGAQPIFRLPSNVQPLHYQLELKPDIYQNHPLKFALSGNVVIRILCTEVTSVIILHAVGLSFSSDGMSVTSAEEGRDSPTVKSWSLDENNEILSLHLDTSLKRTHTYDLHLTFSASMSERFQAVYYSSYLENGETKYLVATIFVPTYARHAFPCFDEPALKAEFTLTILRKANFTSLSNMPKDSSEQRTLPSGEVWFADRFYKTPKMSTYLLTFTVCSFLSRQTNTSRGYIFKAWSRPEVVSQTQYALDVGVKVMAFFDDYFRIPFPLPEQEMIALPEFQYSGMEHWGLVGYKERMLLYSEALPSTKDRQLIAIVIAHELGHMWFGDLLTMVWWDDTWLNEGFATYVQYLGIDYAFPEWKTQEQFLIDSFGPSMSIDAYEQSPPLHKSVIYPDDILAAYDDIIYNKGASVIRMVKFFLGERTFQRGIQRYLEKFKYSSATHEDLWSVLNTEANLDNIQVNVSEVMRGWTVQNNFPVVMVTSTRQGEIRTSQRRFLIKAGASDESHKWDIPFTFATRSTHQPDQDVLPNDVIWLARHQSNVIINHVSIPDPDHEDEWLLGNIGCHGYYRVNYDESNWRALIKQLKTDHQKIGVANRAQIIMDSWNLAKAGQLSYTLALDTLGYLHNESAYVPWKAALTELEELRHVLTPNQTVYSQFTLFVQQLTSPIFAIFHPNFTLEEKLDRRTPLLVARSACSYDLPACVTLARTQFMQWIGQPASNPMSVDLRLTFYCTALAHGNRSEWDFVFGRFQRESTASERTRLRLALTCSRDPNTLNTLLNRTLDPTYIRDQDALETLQECAANRHGRHLVWQFVMKHFSVINDRFGSTAFTLKSLFSGITQSFNTEHELQQLEELAEKYPGAASSFTEAIERTRANIRWVSTNMDLVGQWLRTQNSSEKYAA